MIFTIINFSSSILELEEKTLSISKSIVDDRSVEYSYHELARATNDFGLENQIGSGGFGVVFYAMLRGEVCGIL